MPPLYVTISFAGREARGRHNLYFTERKTKAQRTCETQFLSSQSMLLLKCDPASSLAEPFSTGFSLFCMKELAHSGLANGIWR